MKIKNGLNLQKMNYCKKNTKVSSWRCNAANIRLLHPRPQKRVCNIKEPIEIWANVFRDDMITMVFNNTNNNIMAVIDQLSKEVCNSDK